MSPKVFAALLGATLLALAGSTATALARAAAGPLTPPAAPSDVQISPDFLQLIWVDNSNNESGFVIRALVNGQQFEYQVGANVTSFNLPPEAMAACPASSVTYEVLAFNVYGTSAPATLGIAIDCPPAAPSDLQMFGGVLSWTDNSDNEDGFRITIELRGDLSPEVTVLQFEVGPNVTSFPLPPEAMISCPDVTSISTAIVAFNTFGESEPARAFLVTLCPGLPTATPSIAPPATPTVAGALPQAGAGGGGASELPVVWLVMAGAAGLAALGGAAWRLGRRL